MLDKIEEEIYQLLQNRRKITASYISIKFKITIKFADKLLMRVNLRNRQEARKLAQELEFYEWPAQLSKVAYKNLENFKKKKEKS